MALLRSEDFEAFGPGADVREPVVDELEGTLALAREAEAEWRALIETLPQIVWITRPDGYHVHFNRQWMTFTGLTLEESLGDGWNPAFHPDDRPVAWRLWTEATASGEPYEIEYRLRRHDGVYRWMLGRALPLRDAAGEIVKWFGTCTDIEELKQAQTRIEEQARLLDETHDAIVVHDLDQLWIEVTETAVANLESLTSLSVLHEHGVQVAIDDFGTGWSSLNRLFNFPFDLLKIDRSFISGLAPGSRAAHMVQATISMAHALGMATIAEGVETTQQLEILATMHCDFAQGYLFTEPLSADRIVDAIQPDGTWAGGGTRPSWRSIHHN